MRQSPEVAKQLRSTSVWAAAQARANRAKLAVRVTVLA
jgi:hypothetical protein